MEFIEFLVIVGIVAIIISGLIESADLFVAGIMIIIICSVAFLIKPDKNTTKNNKVRELERNTVFYLKDRLEYKVNDTVWVNMKTQKVDPADSTAMMCVIIE